MIRYLRRLGQALVLLMVLAVLVLTFSYFSDWLWQTLYPLDYREMIYHHAEKNHLDPLLVAAVIRVESNFDPQARSRKGARGLMQVMPSTGEWAAGEMGLKNYSNDLLFDPETNIAVGTWYLARLRSEFDGDTILALAAYNGGRANVWRWVKQKRWTGEVHRVERIPFPETREFVQRVTKAYRRYREIYGSGHAD